MKPKHTDDMSIVREFPHIVTRSPNMLTILRLAEKVANTPNTTVAIYGESGVGKEVIERAIIVTCRQHSQDQRGGTVFAAYPTWNAERPGCVPTQSVGTRLLITKGLRNSLILKQVSMTCLAGAHYEGSP